MTNSGKLFVVALLCVVVAPNLLVGQTNRSAPHRRLNDLGTFAGTWYVDGVNGSDSNNCMSPTTACKTIGHAISLASQGDLISVAPGTYKENLVISIDLKVIGAGADTTIIDGGGVATVVSIAAPHSVTLSNFTIRNGASQYGAGINNSGNLNVIACAITGNIAKKNELANAGGGISNQGTLTVSSSTISSNVVETFCGRNCSIAYGGGVYNTGTLTIINSTLNDNLANAFCTDGDCSAKGGGIYNGKTLRISNSTISGNDSSANCFQGQCDALGGGLYTAGSAPIQNSIISQNRLGANCSGSVTSKGYNLSSDNTCNFTATGDLNLTDPKLGPLQNNGGATRTQALLPGSPAIDAGNPNGCTDGNGHVLKADQRGFPRPGKEDTGGCDMGAYESQSD